MTPPQYENVWISPDRARLELILRGYTDEMIPTLYSSHEEVALSLIAQSDRSHDILGLVKLIRMNEEAGQQG